MSHIVWRLSARRPNVLAVTLRETDYNTLPCPSVDSQVIDPPIALMQSVRTTKLESNA